MSTYEYRVVPAPSKGLKAKGVKSHQARFANAIEDLMNSMAADGWEYQRAETLPSIERSGLTGSSTEWRNVLVFRKPRTSDVAAFAPEVLAAPVVEDVIEDVVEDAVSEDLSEIDDAADDTDDHPAGGIGATHMLPDNGVEETSEVAGMTDSLRNLAEQRSEKTSDKADS
jgi:hypothetical protein